MALSVPFPQALLTLPIFTLGHWVSLCCSAERTGSPTHLLHYKDHPPSQSPPVYPEGIEYVCKDPEWQFSSIYGSLKSIHFRNIYNKVKILDFKGDHQVNSTFQPCLSCLRPVVKNPGYITCVRRLQLCPCLPLLSLYLHHWCLLWNSKCFWGHKQEGEMHT